MWSTLDIINYFIAAIIGGLFLTHLLLKNPKQIWGSSARLSFFVIFLSAFIINLFDFIPNFRVLDTFTFIPLTLSFFQDLFFLLPLYFTVLIIPHLKKRVRLEEKKLPLLHKSLFTFPHILLLSILVGIVASSIVFAMPCDEMECLLNLYYFLPAFVIFGGGTFLLFLIPYVGFIKTANAVFHYVSFIIALLASQALGIIFAVAIAFLRTKQLLLLTTFTPIRLFVEQFAYIIVAYLIASLALWLLGLRRAWSKKSLLLIFLLVGVVVPVFANVIVYNMFIGDIERPEIQETLRLRGEELQQEQRSFKEIMNEALQTNDIAVCKKITDRGQRDGCVDQLTVRKAVVAKDASLCQQVRSKDWKEGCYERLALLLKEPLLCSMAGTKILCFSEVAVATMDPDLCEHSGEFMGSCLRDVAIARKETSICERITNPTDKTSCFTWMAETMKDPNICEFIIEQKDRDWCFARLVPTVTVDSTVCERIMGQSDREYCFSKLP